MSDSCKNCQHKPSDEEQCELGMWGQMFGWCPHHIRKKGTDITSSSGDLTGTPRRNKNE